MSTPTLIRIVLIATLAAGAAAGLVAAPAAPGPAGPAALGPGAPLPPETVAALQALGDELRRKAEARRSPLFARLRAETGGPQGALNADPDLELVGIDARGRPLVFGTENLVAARTVSTDELWPGGASGLDLTGANVAGQLAEWDAGAVMTTHQEFGGRCTIADGASSVHYHSTHVAGTMIASGVVANAHGMSPAAYLRSYEWTNDDSEMATAVAAGLLVSNHSYGYVAGWNYNSTNSSWYWYGDLTVSATEDPGFGIYTSDVRDWDQIARNAPYYLIVKSAGNDRNSAGPGPGGGHYVWSGGSWVWSTDTRDNDGGATGYDSIPYRGTAKNILTVGAVNDIPGGWTSPADVVMSTFSGWGPTDDGRIKPDLVANGIGLYSTYVSSNSSYASYSGTSMACPNASGSLNLLGRYYAQVEGVSPRASTLKALVIHTASEAGGAEGPDYSFGWGLLNARAAADLITADLGFADHIVEATLVSGRRDTLLAQSDGEQPIVATICWTDPAGTPPPWSLDPPTPMLVNDLDLRLERVADGQATLPWVLDPAAPSAPATHGDNVRDNVEKVELTSPAAGLYRLIVSHKGSLSGGSQVYSLITSGLAAAAQAVAPVVSNVTFAERTDGSGLVDVWYDLTDPDSPALTVTIEASTDGGVSWNLAVVTVSGDVGAGVAPGAGRHAVWDFAGDHPGVFEPAVTIRVGAEDGS